MPSSLTIGAFAFGAVLVLIALMGGGFKIFGAEISGKAGHAARWLSGLLGVSLLIIGLYGSVQFRPQFQGPSSKTTAPPAKTPEPRVPTPDQDSSQQGKAEAATVAPTEECQSGSGDALPTDQIKTAKFTGYRPGVGFVNVDYEYDTSAHKNPVYIRVTVFTGHSVIARGFARTTAQAGQARVEVATVAKDQMNSDWAEMALCTEGRAIRVYQSSLVAPWIPE